MKQKFNNFLRVIWFLVFIGLIINLIYQYVIASSKWVIIPYFLISFIALGIISYIQELLSFEVSKTSHGTGYIRKPSGNKNLLTDKLLIGKVNKSKWYFLSDVRHIYISAMTGAGKGVSLILPNLLNYSGGGLIINDLKGENYRLTGFYRRQLGKVIIFDPFNITDGFKSQWDIMSFLRDEFIDDDSRAMATLIIPPSKADDKNSFFTDTARDMLKATIHYLGKDSNLYDVRNCVLNNLNFWSDLSKSDNENLAQMGNMFFNMQNDEPKTYQNIVATFNQFTNFLTSPQVRSSISKSDNNFDIGQIHNDKSSLYFCLPPEQQKPQQALQRLFFGLASNLIVRLNNPENTTCFMLDEFANMGYLPSISDGLTYLRGYGIQIIIVVQDDNQLDSIYGKDTGESIRGNCAHKLYFSVNNLNTAKRISEVIGNKTIEVKSESSKSNSLDKNISKSNTSRAVLTPDEILRSGENTIFYLEVNKPVALLEKVIYYNEVFSKRSLLISR